MSGLGTKILSRHFARSERISSSVMFWAATTLRGDTATSPLRTISEG